MEEEILPVLDKTGKQIGKASRDDCHINPQLLHPVVHLHLFNSQKLLFLQQRVLHKKLNPGLWDTAVGGHVAYGETVDKALFREAKEELGIEVISPVFLFNYIWDNKNETEYVHAYALIYSGPFVFNKEEVMDGKFFSSMEIEKMIKKGLTTTNFNHEFQWLKESNQFK